MFLGVEGRLRIGVGGVEGVELKGRGSCWDLWFCDGFRLLSVSFIASWYMTCLFWPLFDSWYITFAVWGRW